MYSAFSRLLLLGVGTLIVFFLVLIGLRQVGLQRQFQAFDHPLLKDRTFWIVASKNFTEVAPPYTAAAYTAALAIDPQMMFELPLHRSADGVWFVYPSYQLSDLTEQNGFPERLTWDELATLDGAYQFQDSNGEFPFRGKGHKLVTLEEVASLFPKTRFVLSFFDPKGSFVQEAATLINRLDLGQRAVIHSPFSKFVRELKKVEPLWVYGNDSPTLDRAVLLTNLHLEPLASLPSDVIIGNLTRNGSVILSPELVNEIKRQNKKLILIVDDYTPTIPVWILSSLDGVLTNRAEWAARQFRAVPP